MCPTLAPTTTLWLQNLLHSLDRVVNVPSRSSTIQLGPFTFTFGRHVESKRTDPRSAVLAADIPIQDPRILTEDATRAGWR